MQALLATSTRKPSVRDVANNPFSQRNYIKQKRYSDESLRQIEQRLDNITLAQVLLGETCNMTAASLSTMTPGQVFELVHTVSGALAAAVSGAVGPELGDGPNLTNSLASSTRCKYRQTLDDQIGLAGKTSWRDDVKPAMDAGMQKAGLEYRDFPHRETLEKLVAHPPVQNNNRLCVKAGFTDEEAEMLQCLLVAPIASEIGLGCMEASPRYAALTHAGYKTLARKAISGDVAPKCFHYISDAGTGLGLADRDPRWLSILKPDATGFQGFTSFAPLKMAMAIDMLHSPDGIKANFTGVSRADWPAVDSDVICFESMPPTDGGQLHSAVDVGGKSCMLPPFTLLTVARVDEPGTWEYLPGKRMDQRLITVRMTFVTPAEQGSGGTAPAKFACNHNFLRFGNAGMCILIICVQLGRWWCSLLCSLQMTSSAAL
jgi:hypothetical protein